MSIESKYSKMVVPLMKQSLFTVREAEKRGVSRQALVYYEKMGVIERLKRGVYRSIDQQDSIDILYEGMIVSHKATANSVICLISALYYYDLTDEIPREHWLAVPNTQKAPQDSSRRVVRMRNVTLGRVNVKIDGVSVQIFDRERCIVDAFRYLSIEVAIQALKSYLKSKPNQLMLRRLDEYGKILRVNLKPYLLSLML